MLSKIQVRNFTDFNNWPPSFTPPFFYLETMVSLERNNNVNLTFLRMFFIPRPYCLWGMQKLVQHFPNRTFLRTFLEHIMMKTCCALCQFKFCFCKVEKHLFKPCFSSSCIFARWTSSWKCSAALILSYVYLENRASGKLHKRKITIIQITKLCKKERSKK